MANSTLGTDKAAYDENDKMTATVEVANLDPGTPDIPGTPGRPAYDDMGVGTVSVDLSDGRHVEGEGGTTQTLADGTEVKLSGGTFTAHRDAVPDEPGTPGTPAQTVTRLEVSAPGMTFSQVSGDADTGVFEAAAKGDGAVTVTSKTYLSNRAADDPQVRTAQVTVKKAVPPPPPPPPPDSAMLVGWSMSDEPHPGVCGVSRIYDPSSSDLATAVNTHKVKRIALSSDDDVKTPATVVSRIKAVLAKYPALEIDYAHENEVDRTDHRGGSDADAKAWCAEHKAIQDAIHAAFPADGSKGKVKTAVDFTAWNARTGRTRLMLTELKRIGGLPDVLGASMYPAGRKDSPPTESPMKDHIDIFVDFAVEFGIKLVSCWEIGTPVSTNYDRPALVTKWVKRLRDYSKSKGVTARDFIYWDQEKSGGPKNPFHYDGSTSTVQGKTQKALLAA